MEERFARGGVIKRMDIGPALDYVPADPMGSGCVYRLPAVSDSHRAILAAINAGDFAVRPAD